MTRASVGRSSCSDSVAGSSVGRRPVRLLRLCCLTIALTPLLLGFTLPGTVERLCGRGNRLYKQEKYKEAGESYARALKLRPGDPTLHYNQGAALYKAGDLPGASQAFSAAMADVPEDLQEDLHYNIGNTRYRMGDLKGAIEQYKQALRLNPDDGEAKYNLELALRKLKEQEKQQKQQQDEEQKKEQQSKQDQEKQSQQQNAQQEQQQEEQAKQQQAQANEQQAKQSQAQKAQESASEAEKGKEDKGLTKEQAAALLRALAAEETALQRIIRRAPPSAAREVQKDW